MTHTHPEAMEYEAAAPELARAASSNVCEECKGTRVIERKEDGAPMECWACGPAKVTR